MKINFCVNTTGLTGGIKVVFIYANKLSERGHDVTIIYPYNLSGKWFSKEGFLAILKWVKYGVLRQRVEWFDLKVPVMRVPTLSKKWVPDADITIATANETADWVEKLSIEKGRKVYFIQDYEKWSRDEKLVDETYKMPFKKIVNVSWLKKLMEEKFNDKNTEIVTNGVDLKVFYNNDKKFNKNKKILMMYHILAKKGISDGFEAYRVAKKKHPEIKLVLFSVYPRGADVPKEAEFHQNPSQKLLRNLYSSADIFISPSWQEGWHLPPMESMACKTAVLATNVGGIPFYTIPGKTAIVVPPRKPKILAKALLDLIENDKKLKEISFAGFEFIKKFSWDESVSKFENILENETNFDLSKLSRFPKIGIQVLNWNQKKITADCINKLLKINYPNFEIFVIDNGSADDSPEFLKKQFGSKIEIIETGKNLGFAKANNLGLKILSKKGFDYILLLNNDVEVKTDFLTEMLKTSLQNPKSAMVVSKVFYADKDKTFQSAGGNFIKYLGEPRLRGHLEKNLEKFEFPIEVDFAPGVCILIPTKVLKKIGFIPEEYFMFSEDVDWSFQAKKAGFKIIYSPKSEIIHIESKTAGQESSTKMYYYIRNNLIMMKKDFPLSFFYFVFLPSFSFKILKMGVKYLLSGKNKLNLAIIKAIINFKKGETGKSREFIFK